MINRLSLSHRHHHHPVAHGSNITCEYVIRLFHRELIFRVHEYELYIVRRTSANMIEGLVAYGMVCAGRFRKKLIVQIAHVR